MSGAEAIARLAEHPADVILVDAAVTRPDSVAFTRGVMSSAPRAVLVLFGVTEPRVAAAAVAAGARGVIRGGDGEDIVTTVAKTVLLVLQSADVADVAGVVAAAGAGFEAMTTEGPALRGSAALPDGNYRTPPGAAAAAPRIAAGGVLRPAPMLVPQQRADAAVATDRRRPALTEREMQVLRGMADGKSNAEIGHDLYVSEDTVKTHARRLFRKLGARDRAHAVAAGFRTGLVT